MDNSPNQATGEESTLCGPFHKGPIGAKPLSDKDFEKLFEALNQRGVVWIGGLDVATARRLMARCLDAEGRLTP